MGESKTSPPASSNRQEYNPSYNYAPYFIITPCHGHDDTNLSRSATQHQYHSTPPFTKPYEEPNLKSDWIGNAKTTRTKIFAIHRTSQMSTRRGVLSKRITDRTRFTIDPVVVVYPPPTYASLGAIQCPPDECVLSRRITDRTHLTIDPVLLCTLLPSTDASIDAIHSSSSSPHPNLTLSYLARSPKRDQDLVPQITNITKPCSSQTQYTTPPLPSNLTPKEERI